jgi:hypothetical protein
MLSFIAIESARTCLNRSPGVEGLVHSGKGLRYLSPNGFVWRMPIFIAIESAPINLNRSP